MVFDESMSQYSWNEKNENKGEWSAVQLQEMIVVMSSTWTTQTRSHSSSFWFWFLPLVLMLHYFLSFVFP